MSAIQNVADAESLCEVAGSVSGMTLWPVAWLEGGDEARVLHVMGPASEVVLHVSPPWRRKEQLLFAHGVASQAATTVDQVVAPLTFCGRTTFEWNSCQVAIYPFIQGETLDRDDAALRVQAAELLANIHRALEGLPKPLSGNGAAALEAPLAELVDEDHERWWRDHAPTLKWSMIHGDYYRGNILCHAERIVGIIDWHETQWQPLALELAGATFELCKSPDNLIDLDRAQEFVSAYLAAEGPLPSSDIVNLIPLVREWIKRDISGSIRSGTAIDHEYIVRQLYTFRALRSQHWAPRG